MTQKKTPSGTPADPPNALTPLPPARRGWGSLLLAILLIGAWLLADDGLQRGAPHGGFHGPAPSVIVSAEEFPRFWSESNETATMARFKEHWPAPLESVQLDVRQTTGIRPTPSRWRFWLGRRILVANTPEGWGICVYPGLAIRLLSPLFRPDADGVRQYGSYFFVRRDGYLIASLSRDYVQAALTGPSVPREPLDEQASLRIRRPEPPEADFRVYAETGVPVSGRVAMTLTSRERPLTLPHVWPIPPIAQINTSRLSDMRAIWMAMEAMIPATPEWEAIREAAMEKVAHWELGDLPAGYDRIVDECALALLDVEQHGMLPWPDLALIMRSPRAIRGPHPLEAWVEPLPRMPAEWQGQAGQRAFLLGEALTLCLGRHDRDWYLTSREPIMARLAGKTENGIELDADAYFSVDWAGLLDEIEPLLTQAAEWQLLPVMGPQEFHAQWGPRLQAMRSLGTLRLEGQAEGLWLVFEGMLAEADHRVP